MIRQALAEWARLSWAARALVVVGYALATAGVLLLVWGLDRAGAL